MHYKIIDNSAFADDGYIFVLKSDGSPMGKCMDKGLIPYCDCIPEPEPEPEPEQEVEENGESDVSV